MMFRMIFVRISSLCGTQIRLLYHIKSSFHWVSPRAIFPSSVCPFFSAFLISLNWWFSSLAIFSLTFVPSCIWVSMVLSWIDVRQYFSLGSNVMSLCVFLVSLGVGISPDLLVSASSLPPSSPGRYSILMLKLASSSFHWICLPFRVFVVVNGTKFLCSVVTILVSSGNTCSR